MAFKDPDKFFAYETKKVVRIHDRALAAMYFFAQIVVWALIVFGIFYLGQAHREFEGARGYTVYTVEGDVVAVSSGKSGSRYMSAEELTYPGLENGNVFVATRLEVVKQTRSTCKDYSRPCDKDSDCAVEHGGTCPELDYCVEPAWCDSEERELYQLEVSNLKIWLKSTIQFRKLAASQHYSTESYEPGKKAGYNYFSVREILDRCSVRYEEISELGAAIEVQVQWNCKVEIHSCGVELRAKRLDHAFNKINIGYSFKYAEYISETERILQEVRGIRIFLRTYGIGSSLSMSGAILKGSTISALFYLATIFVDFIMLNCMKRRHRYKALKYVDSDVQEYLKMHDKHGKTANANQDSYHEMDEIERKAQHEEEDWRRRVDEEQ